MSEDNSLQRVEVEVPRSHLVVIRRLFKGASVKQAIEQCVETFTKGWQSGIELSTQAISEISSLLNIQTFNSESSLIQAIQKRLNAGPRTIVFEMDEQLAVMVRAKAKGNSANFNEYVKNFVHSMFRYGMLDWNLHSIFFADRQWDRIRRALGKTPITGENFARIFEEWAHFKAQQDLGKIEATPASVAAPESERPKASKPGQPQGKTTYAEMERSAKAKLAAQKPPAPVAPKAKLPASVELAEEAPPAENNLPPEPGTAEERAALVAAMDKVTSAKPIPGGTPATRSEPFAPVTPQPGDMPLTPAETFRPPVVAEPNETEVQAASAIPTF
jgi:hypothetical protein